MCPITQGVALGYALLPLQGEYIPLYQSVTQGVATLCPGLSAHWAFSPLILQNKNGAALEI